MQMTSRVRAMVLAFAVLTAGQPAAGEDKAPAGVATVTAEVPVVLVPHRAVYDLTLNAAKDSGGVTGVLGRMVFETSGAACEGYTTNFRMLMDLTDRNGGRHLSDLTMISFESGDGDLYRFVSEESVDNVDVKKLEGSAERRGDGTLEVKITVPQEKTLSSDKPMLLPSQHLIESIRKARAGVHFFEAPVYDGSDTGDKFFTTTSIIGAAENPEAEDPELAVLPEDLRAEPTWPVTLSYFDLADRSGEPTPVYKLSFALFDNGISRKITMDYGDFALDGKLVELELLDLPACAKGD